MTDEEQKTMKEHLDAARAGTPVEELRATRDRIARACAAELHAVLAKHGCELVAIPQFMPDGSGVFKVGARVELTVKQ